MPEDYSEEEKTNFTCSIKFKHSHEYDDIEDNPYYCVEHIDETNI